MSFYKVTYNEKYRFATVHNFGCTFKCSICSYKLRSGAEGKPGHAYPRPEKFLATEEIQGVLQQVRIEKLFFMGGEPTVSKELPELLSFAKIVLGVATYLGHTNGSNLSLANLDGANVGLKAWDEKVHLEYTGRPKKKIFDNFQRAFEAGLDLKANIVYVPGLVDLDQIEAVVAWLAGLSRDIPFHIMGYIPVPGQSYPRPTTEQMAQAETVCRKHLTQVASSHLDSSQARCLSTRDDRFVVKQLL